MNMLYSEVQNGPCCGKFLYRCMIDMATLKQILQTQNSATRGESSYNNLGERGYASSWKQTINDQYLLDISDCICLGIPATIALGPSELCQG